MSTIEEIVELELTPIPPDTIAFGKAEVGMLIEQVLRSAGKERLLADQEIQAQVEDTFPTDAVIVIIFTFLSGAGLETYKQLILPELKRRYEVRQRSKEENESDKDNNQD